MSGSIDDFVTTVGTYAAVGAALGGALAMAFSRKERLERWAAKGSVFGGAWGLGTALARVLAG